MKCDLCGSRIELTFLNKIVGTYVRDRKGKRRVVCPECQKKFSKEDILEKL